MNINVLPYDIETHEEIGRQWLHYELSTRNEFLNYRKAEGAQDLEYYLHSILKIDKIKSLENELEEVKAQLKVIDLTGKSSKKVGLEQNQNQLKAQLELEKAKAKRILERPRVKKKIARYQNLIKGRDSASKESFGVASQFSHEGDNEVSKATMEDAQATVAKTQMLLKELESGINNDNELQTKAGEDLDKETENSSGKKDEVASNEKKKNIKSEEKKGLQREKKQEDKVNGSKDLKGESKTREKDILNDIVYANSF